jgi:hypothetical protein
MNANRPRLTVKPSLPTAEFADSMEREIIQRTWGRIHRLQVEVWGNRLHVYGYTPTYYVKQLAIQAVLEKQESTGGPPVDVDIEVGVGEARSVMDGAAREVRKPFEEEGSHVGAHATYRRRDRGG